MTARPYVIVGGMPGLRHALDASGVFADVAGRDTCGQIVELLSSPQVQGRTPDQTVFVFSDTLAEDNPDWALAQIIRVLSANNYKVLIVARTVAGQQLAQKHPGVGLLPMPVALNAVLYAMSTFGFQMPADLPGMFDPIDLDDPSPPARPAPAQPSSAPVAVSASGSAKPAFGGGWSVPDEVVVDPAPAPARSAAPPPASAPAQGGRPVPFGAGAPAPFGSGSPGRPGSSGSAPPPRPTFGGAPGPVPGPGSRSAPAPKPWDRIDAPPPRPAGGHAAQPQPRPAMQPQSAGWTGGMSTREGGGYVAAAGPANRRGWVITIAVPKGGAGKSSLALNLAAYLGMRLRSQGKTVCVIDSNFQQADLGKYLDVYTPNINTIANNPSMLNLDRILDGLVHKSEWNLSALLGPATPDEGNPLNIDANLYIEILDLLRQLYDYIIIDTPVAEKFHDIFAKFALPKANYIIVPVAPNFPTLHNADNWLHSAVVAPPHSGGAGVDRSRIGVLLNRAEDDIGCSIDDVRRTMASWNFIGAIPETKEWKACNNRNELIAPKAYGELLESFAEVMYAATGEQALIENLSMIERPKTGLLAKLKKRAG